MELKDTIELMQSNDYKERFKAEYYQTLIRYEKLKSFNDKIELNEKYDIGECPIHTCPSSLLREQQRQMGMYLHILEQRAYVENIEL